MDSSSLLTSGLFTAHLKPLTVGLFKEDWKACPCSNEVHLEAESAQNSFERLYNSEDLWGFVQHKEAGWLAARQKTGDYF